MIHGKKVLALIPARSGSKGLPMKNIKLLQGRPLLTWPIAAAQSSAYVDRIIVSTDDAEFAKLAARAGADVPFLRPDELATDSAPSILFILHAIDTLETAGEKYDYLVLLEPTSPLTEGADIDAALESLVKRRADADAVVSISELVSTHPAFVVRVNNAGIMSPYLGHSFGQLPRRQDVEPLYSLDGSLYISTVDALRREESFCHERTIPHKMSRYKSFEVDDLVDFICIEALLAQRELVAD